MIFVYNYIEYITTRILGKQEVIRIQHNIRKSPFGVPRLRSYGSCI